MRETSPTAPGPATVEVDAHERLRHRVLRVLASIVVSLVLVMYPVGVSGGYASLVVLAWFVLAVPAFLEAILATAATRDRIAGPITPHGLGLTISLLTLEVCIPMALSAVSGFVEQVCGPDPDLRLVMVIIGVFVLTSVASVSVALHVTRDTRSMAAAWVTPLGLAALSIVAAWATTADCS